MTFTEKGNWVAKGKITRKDLLKGTDEFLTISAKAANLVSTHARQLRYIGVGIAVVIVGYLAVYFYLSSVNKKGQNAYNSALYSLTENMKPNPDPENLRKSEELFTKVLEEYGLAKVARLAFPQVAHVKFLERKFEKAIVFYLEFLDKVSGDTQYEFLTNLALATCYEAMGEIKAAIDTLNPVVHASGGLFKETTMLSLARLYRLDNKPEKAEEILREFVEQYKDSPFLPMAKAHFLEQQRL